MTKEKAIDRLKELFPYLDWIDALNYLSINEMIDIYLSDEDKSDHICVVMQHNHNGYSKVDVDNRELLQVYREYSKLMNPLNDMKLSDIYSVFSEIPFTNTTIPLKDLLSKLIYTKESLDEM